MHIHIYMISISLKSHFYVRARVCVLHVYDVLSTNDLYWSTMFFFSFYYIIKVPYLLEVVELLSN